MPSWIASLGSLLGRHRPQGHTIADVGSVGARPSSPAGPLAPQFDRSQSRFQGRIQRAVNHGRFLGNNFNACAGQFVICNADAPTRFFGYRSHKPQDATIRTALPNDRLDMTIVMNVSGHDLKDRPNRDALRAARAKNNRYVIKVTHPDGRVQRMKDIRADGALFTVQDISIENVKPGKIIVEVWPEGSAGVGGYVEGRRLEIDYCPPQMNRGSSVTIH